MPTIHPALHVAAPAGAGEPLVLVHGGWTDHTTFDLVAGPLARSYRVVRYDRRGHTLSSAARGDAPTPRRVDEDDLISIVESAGRAHLVGTSYGASISLAVAARRPDLVRSVVAHEPPLLSLAPDPGADAVFAAVQAQIARGDAEGGTRAFFEEILGAGGWERLPAPLRAAAIANAQTFADLAGIEDWATMDVDGLARFPRPVVITRGDQSPAWLHRAAHAVAEQAGREVRVIAGAGHSPHLTHPDAHVAVVEDVAGSALSRAAA
jgi:pimeloyl-ACP methyl ester carboxylesterase